MPKLIIKHMENHAKRQTVKNIYDALILLSFELVFHYRVSLFCFPWDHSLFLQVEVFFCPFTLYK